jgi:antitoxin CcdA
MVRHFSDSRRPFKGAELSSDRDNRGKQSVRVSVDAELLKSAGELDVNLSKALEDALRTAIEAERVRRWQIENRAFTDSYNAYIERNGVAGEELLDLDDPPA